MRVRRYPLPRPPLLEDPPRLPLDPELPRDAEEELRLLLDEPRLRTEERDGVDLELDELRLRTDDSEDDGAGRESDEPRLLRTVGLPLLREDELLGVTAPLPLLLRGLRLTVASRRAAGAELLVRTFLERSVR